MVPHFFFFATNGLPGAINPIDGGTKELLNSPSPSHFWFIKIGWIAAHLHFFHSLPSKLRLSTPTCAGAVKPRPIGRAALLLLWFSELGFEAVACCSLRIDLCLDLRPWIKDSSCRGGPSREGNGKTRLLALSLSLLIRTERSFRKARPISFVAAKDEFDPLGSSICSERKRETRKHLWLLLKGTISNRPRSNFGSFLGEHDLP